MGDLVNISVNIWVNYIKQCWLYMLTPPWQRVEASENRARHILIWILGWTWAIAGIILGAWVAPYLLEVANVANSSYSDGLVVGIATISGFLTQFIGWCLIPLIALTLILLIVLINVTAGDMDQYVIRDYIEDTSRLMTVTIFLVAAPLPLILVGIAFNLYVTKIGSQDGIVTIGVIGGVLLKIAISMGFPLVKSLVVGFILARFMLWLRGGSKKKDATGQSTLPPTHSDPVD